jgi:predicted DNA-binding transcriptional regulator YafY
MPGFPFAREARSALRKLSFDLPMLARRRDPGDSYYAAPTRTAALRDRIGLLARALLDRKRVRFTYHGIRRGEATERKVAPYGMLFHAGQWYLVGHDALREAERIFRVGRMEDVEQMSSGRGTPEYEIPPDFSLEEWRTRDAWELGSDDEEIVEARVAFTFPRSLWADRNGKGRLLEERPDGGQLRGFEVRQPEPFLRWILSLEGNARIEAPDALAAALGEMVRDVLALYEVEGEGGPDA